MSITFFIRGEKGFVSIGKLFRPLISEIGKSEVAETFYMPSEKYGLTGILKNLWFTYIHRNKNGVNHITGDCHFIIFALIGCKTVLTVHDLGFYTVHKKDRNWIKRFFLYYMQVYWPIKLADKVIAISEKTRQEIIDTVPFKREILIARHVNVDSFHYSPKTLDKNNIRIMQCGTRPHKNLETTIKALKGIPCELRVVKQMTEEQKQLARDNGVAFSNVYNITDEEMIQEYRNADIVCFPSIYEGFGAITLEAQATGRPVITCDREPMKSVSGGAASLLKDPTSVEEMKQAILKLINEDDYRQDLIEKGLANAQKYSLENCAKEHLDIYRSI